MTITTAQELREIAKALRNNTGRPGEMADMLDADADSLECYAGAIRGVADNARDHDNVSTAKTLEAIARAIWKADSDTYDDSPQAKPITVGVLVEYGGVTEIRASHPEITVIIADRDYTDDGEAYEQARERFDALEEDIYKA